MNKSAKTFWSIVILGIGEWAFWHLQWRYLKQFYSSDSIMVVASIIWGTLSLGLVIAIALTLADVWKSELNQLIRTVRKEKPYN